MSDYLMRCSQNPGTKKGTSYDALRVMADSEKRHARFVGGTAHLSLAFSTPKLIRAQAFSSPLTNLRSNLTLACSSKEPTTAYRLQKSGRQKR